MAARGGGEAQGIGRGGSRAPPLSSFGLVVGSSGWWPPWWRWWRREECGGGRVVSPRGAVTRRRRREHGVARSRHDERFSLGVVLGGVAQDVVDRVCAESAVLLQHQRGNARDMRRGSGSTKEVRQLVRGIVQARRDERTGRAVAAVAVIVVEGGVGQPQPPPSNPPPGGNSGGGGGGGGLTVVELLALLAALVLRLKLRSHQSSRSRALMPLRLTTPGTPTTRLPGGTELSTTAFAPMSESRPMRTSPRILAPGAM